MEVMTWVFNLIGVFAVGVNAAFFVVIKFNDMKHMGDDIKEIKENIHSLILKSEKNAEQLAEIKGRCKANHG